LEKKAAIIHRFELLGDRRHQALADFFENTEYDYRLREATFSILRITHAENIKDSPMLMAIREDIKRVVDSNFEYRGNLLVHSIIFLNNFGDEHDLALLESFLKLEKNVYRWETSTAIEQIKGRVDTKKSQMRRDQWIRFLTFSCPLLLLAVVYGCLRKRREIRA
jgi:hypothetical protein